MELCLRKTKERYKNCVLVLKRRFQEKLEVKYIFEEGSSSLKIFKTANQEVKFES